MARDIGIDLGTSSVLIYLKGKGIVLEEPSVVAYDTETGAIRKIGREAEAMIGRTPPHIATARPMRDGVISQYDLTLKMLQYYLRRAGGAMTYKPRLVICVPSGITEVEERAVVDAGIQAGARRAYLIEEPVAAAIGEHVDLLHSPGTMIIDLGAGTVEISVLALGGIVSSRLLKIGGDIMNEAICDAVKENCHLLIGQKTAEWLKLELGSAFDSDEVSRTVPGRDLISGLPSAADVKASLVHQAIKTYLSQITDTARELFEHTPPEIARSISISGVIVTGEGSRLKHLQLYIERALSLPVVMSEYPDQSVILGLGAIMSNDKLKRMAFSVKEAIFS